MSCHRLITAFKSPTLVARSTSSRRRAVRATRRIVAWSAVLLLCATIGWSSEPATATAAASIDITAAPSPLHPETEAAIERALSELLARDADALLRPELLGGIDDPQLTDEERLELIGEAIVQQTRAFVADPAFRRQVTALTSGGSSQTVDQNDVAVPLQLGAGVLYRFGQSRIRKALFSPFQLTSKFPPRVHRRTLQEIKDYNPAKLIAEGTVAIGAAVAFSYLSPPVVVEPGWRSQSFSTRLSAAQGWGWRPPGPPEVNVDVDLVGDPASCTATLTLDADEGGVIRDYGEFDERELAWVDPFGSFPGLGSQIGELMQAILGSFGSYMTLEDIEGISSSGSIQVPVVGTVANFIDDLLDSALSVEDLFYNSFTGWEFGGEGINCSGGTCTAPDGRSRARFNGTFSSVPGILEYDFSYWQGLRVVEYFAPTFTGIQVPLTVYLEALEPGGAPTNLPVVEFDGNPPAGRSAILDPTWFGLTDNCDPAPLLEWDLPPFLELGIHQIALTGTDRSDNATNAMVTVVVRDSLPPDILPPGDVGITAPVGATVLPFTDPGVGCVTWLCEGNPATFQLYPPTIFDFASLEPATIGCQLTNSLYPTGADCATSDLAVGELNLVEWTFIDNSGNQSSVTQNAFVREEGTNQTPATQGGSFTVATGVPAEIPLAATDDDFDPLTFAITDLPDHGDLDVELDAIYQTRFAAGGAIRRATSFLKMEQVPGGGTTDLLVVADGPAARLLVFDIAGDDVLIHDIVDLQGINPDAIQFNRDPRLIQGSSLNSVLNGRFFILDTTQDGPADTSVNTLWWWNGGTPRRLADFGPFLGGLEARDFRISGIDFSGADRSIDVQLYMTGDPVFFDDAGVAVENPANERQQFYLSSNDSGVTWNTPLVIGSPVSETGMSVVEEPFNGCLYAYAAWRVNDPNGLPGYGQVSGGLDLTPHMLDPDGPTNPALPVLQDPTSMAVLSCGGSSGRIAFMESQNNWLEAFDFQAGNSTLTRVQNLQFPIRLTNFLEIRSINEILDGATSPRFIVLDETGLYRFDLAGRLEAHLVMPSGSGGDAVKWIDSSLDTNGWIYTLTEGDSSNGSDPPTITRRMMQDGVDNFTDDGRAGQIAPAEDAGWAIAADTSHAFALAGDGLYRCTSANVGVCTQLLTNPNAPFRDVEIRMGTSELFVTNVTTNQVERRNRDTGALIAAFTTGSLDFFLDGASASDLRDVAAGRLAYDAAADRVYVSDFPLSDPGDPLSMRIPRVTVYSGDGALLETVVPEYEEGNFMSWLQPGDFGSVTSIAVGPDRVYIAEATPLKRLHVYDASVTTPVTCDDPEAECRTVTYTSDVGYTGPDAFDYDATDPFGGMSSASTINLTVVDDMTAPSLTCPTNLMVEARDPGGIDLVDPLEQEPNADLRAFFAPATSDNVDLPPPVVTRDVGSSFPVGATVVTFTSTDAAGNQTTCQATLTVVDTTPPQFEVTAVTSEDGLEITLPTIATVVVEATAPQTPFSPPDPSVLDAAGLVSLTHDGPADYPLGETLITWTAIDLGGNTSTAAQIVRIEDTTAPAFDTPLPPGEIYNQVANNGYSNAVFYDVQTATDAVGVTDVDCSPAIGAPLSFGTHTITCIARDGSGNVGRRTFQVDIDDGDSDGDGVGDLIDPDPPGAGGSAPFDDTAFGGMTSGVIDTFGGHSLLVTDGPEADEGLTVLVKGQTDPTPARVSICSGALAAEVDFTTFEPEPGVFEDANDWVVLTCLSGGGVAARSELGTIETEMQTPGGQTLDAVIDSYEEFSLVGWNLTVPADSSGPVALSLETTGSVAPGQTIDVRSLLLADVATAAGATNPIVEPGQPLQIGVTVANQGPSTAETVTLTIGIPSGIESVTTTGCAEDPAGYPTCTLGSIVNTGQTGIVLDAVVGATPDPLLLVDFTVNALTSDPVPGNNLSTVAISTEGTPPTVTAFGTDLGSALDVCSVLTQRPQALTVAFNEPMQAGAAPVGNSGAAVSADDPAGYRLVAGGLDNSLQTLDCSSVLGDDVALPLDSVTLAPDAQSVTFGAVVPLPDGLLGLLVCGDNALVDLAGNPLDGDGNGTGGDDTGIIVRVDHGNLLLGHADCDLADSTITPPGSATWSSLDHQASSQSGSVEVVLPAGDVELTQCSSGPFPSAPFRVAGALEVQGGTADVTATLSCGWSATCSAVSSSTVMGSVSASPGLGWEIGSSPATVPPRTTSLLSCTWTLTGEPGQQVRVDALELKARGIFWSGFEGGGSGGWSQAFTQP